MWILKIVWSLRFLLGSEVAIFSWRCVLFSRHYDAQRNPFHLLLLYFPYHFEFTFHLSLKTCLGSGGLSRDITLNRPHVFWNIYLYAAKVRLLGTYDVQQTPEILAYQTEWLDVLYWSWILWLGFWWVDHMTLCFVAEILMNYIPNLKCSIATRYFPPTSKNLYAVTHQFQIREQRSHFKSKTE